MQVHGLWQITVKFIQCTKNHILPLKINGIIINHMKLDLEYVKFITYNSRYKCFYNPLPISADYTWNKTGNYSYYIKIPANYIITHWSSIRSRPRLTITQLNTVNTGSVLMDGLVYNWSILRSNNRVSGRRMM